MDFLIHLRSSSKDRHPNKWDTRFGGHVGSGISLENTIISELREEIGLEIKIEQLYEGYWAKYDEFPDCKFSKSYFLEYNNDIQNLKFNDGEVWAVKWMRENEIQKLLAEEPEKWAPSLNGFMKMLNYIRSIIK